MHALRRRLRPAAWLAAAAVLLLALLPTLGHAWGAGPSGWALVCGTQGPHWVALDGDGGTPAALQVPGDCAACLWTATPLPPVAAVLALRPPAVVVQPLPSAVATVPRLTWRHAAPRGPPAS
ncbi:MAG: DUF2946 family protein [Rubrivivax sp.]|nr:DUF2946 family protein [Rubrivivax sp.]